MWKKSVKNTFSLILFFPFPHQKAKKSLNMSTIQMVWNYIFNHRKNSVEDNNKVIQLFVKNTDDIYYNMWRCSDITLIPLFNKRMQAKAQNNGILKKKKI